MTHAQLPHRPWTVPALKPHVDTRWTGRFADACGVPAHRVPTRSMDSPLRVLPTGSWTTLRAPAERPPWVAHTAHNLDDDDEIQKGIADLRSGLGIEEVGM